MFQSPFQIVHIYQVLWFEYFFKKIGARFNLILIFLTLKHFFQKTYKNTYCFYEIFSKFLSRSTRSQNFVIWNFYLKKKMWFFQNVNNLLFISTTLSNICGKTYENFYYFYIIFSKFFSSYSQSQTFVVRKFLERKYRFFRNINKFLLRWVIFNNFYEKTYEKTYCFLDIFSNFMSSCARSQNFTI